MLRAVAVSVANDDDDDCLIVDDGDGFDDHGTNGDDDYKQEEAIGENGGLKSSVSQLSKRR